MMAHLGLFAPILDQLAVVMIKVAIDSVDATPPALCMVLSSGSFSNLPLQVICISTIFISILCYTARGTKMIKLSSKFGFLLLKQLSMCLLYPHCLSLNNAAYQFTLTKLGVRNIPDNNLLEDKILCTIDLESQDKKLQQFPLSGGTAARQQPRAVRRPHAQPGSSPVPGPHLPASQWEAAHPPRWDCPPLPDGETAK
ncbi:hypothetical protein DSO57_1020306 [Entomophthora muscae]|uniref:Uncharacterized protein n=1 Tax=Entomophthora muscae TaxID=34485 RepID=A0ACC2RUU0_9FUNG|nr:hypothetical protein DSO57_1020306 [Entomophthora muscae]